MAATTLTTSYREPPGDVSIFHLVKVSPFWMIVLAVVGIAGQACGEDCDGVGLVRVRPTETTIAVGESFVALYEEGGSCDLVFTPVTDEVWWSSDDATIASVDSASGEVEGKRTGDALILPHFGSTAATFGILVHVR